MVGLFIIGIVWAPPTSFLPAYLSHCYKVTPHLKFPMVTTNFQKSKFLSLPWKPLPDVVPVWVHSTSVCFQVQPLLTHLHPWLMWSHFRDAIPYLPPYPSPNLHWVHCNLSLYIFCHQQISSFLKSDILCGDLAFMYSALSIIWDAVGMK